MPSDPLDLGTGPLHFDERPEDQAHKLIQTVYMRDEIQPLEDGFYRYFPSSRGGLNAWELRTIADELDNRNRDWQAQIDRELGTIRGKSDE